MLIYIWLKCDGIKGAAAWILSWIKIFKTRTLRTALDYMQLNQNRNMKTIFYCRKGNSGNFWSIRFCCILLLLWMMICLFETCKSEKKRIRKTKRGQDFSGGSDAHLKKLFRMSLSRSTLTMEEVRKKFASGIDSLAQLQRNSKF